MKKRNLFRISMMVLILSLPFFSSSQSVSSIALDIEAGATLLTAGQVKSMYGPGIKITAGPKISLMDNQKL